MIFEELVLRPAPGVVDVAGIGAWLDAQPYAFKDPVAGEGWHVSASPRLMAMNRARRVERPREWPLGLRVVLAPDHVWVAARADRHDLARGLQVVQRVVRDGAWTVEVDGGPARPVDDARRLFPSELPDPRTLVDDEPWATDGYP
jgi:hypothetical protein